jgi:acetyl-CoA C-acetyltransferase
MSSQPEVFVVSAARTAIGTFGGALKDMPLADLATTAVKAAIERSGAEPGRIGHLAMGTVILTEPRDAYLSRVAAMNAGLPKETPAFNVNRLCGSGLQAIVSAAQSILLGDCDMAIGAGAECMSRGAYVSTATRFGARMGDTQMLDLMVGALHDPFHKIHMGITAENVAEQFGISREQMDELATESHRRAAAAIEAGRFKEQIVPVVMKTRKGDVIFDTDEHVKAGTTVEKLAAMRAAFKKDGKVTAGNASGVNDGAAAILLASGDAAQKNGLKPIARVVGMAAAGVAPRVMGIGPVPATRKVLARAGLTIDQMDVIELNEAFASQGLATLRELGVADDAPHVNANGGAIALGHPLGMSGARLVLTAAYQLQRTGGRYALCTMCVGVGQGAALILERV